jgi:hypothetical protein
MGDEAAMQVEVLVDGVREERETETLFDKPVPLSEHLPFLLHV